MRSKIPRVHTVLEPPLYEAVRRLAKRAGVSMSQEVRDLVEDALELIEDAGLDRLAEERRKTFQTTKSLSVADVRRRLKLR